MKQIKIYRVQDKDGRGPFKPGFSHQWVEQREDHQNLLPWPVEFKKIQLPMFMNVGVGCRTLSQLRRWFLATEYKKLLEFGYLAVSLVPDQIIAESDIQLVFGRIRKHNEGIKPAYLYGGEVEQWQNLQLK